MPDLQAVTGRFDKKNLIGCAYKAMFSDGEILAVKRLDHATESSSSEDFMDAVAGISRMRHPNIIELVGYCSEPGHHLLVYEFLKNGSLYDCLHLSDDYSKPLTWNIRIKTALGTARAKENVQMFYAYLLFQEWKLSIKFHFFMVNLHNNYCDYHLCIHCPCLCNVL